jgi:hypothetical protein
VYGMRGSTQWNKLKQIVDRNEYNEISN